MVASDLRMPTIYVPHGGGPWPWMDTRGFFGDDEKAELTELLVGLPARLPQLPQALLVISAHWEAPRATVSSHPAPPLLYDYYGFPPATYQLTWPAPGAPALAQRVQALLAAAGHATAEDPQRGFDHGTFVPLKLAFPRADVPVVQLSLVAGLEPALHLALGRALAPLRDEGVLIVGSGMSFHNMRDLRAGLAAEQRRARSQPFHAWLQAAVEAPPAARAAALQAWAAAPHARVAHPREEHLLPLMVVAGAAADDPGRVTFAGTFAGFDILAAQFAAA